MKKIVYWLLIGIIIGLILISVEQYVNETSFNYSSGFLIQGKENDKRGILFPFVGKIIITQGVGSGKFYKYYYPFKESTTIGSPWENEMILGPGFYTIVFMKEGSIIFKVAEIGFSNWNIIVGLILGFLVIVAHGIIKREIL
ncbi:MAG TPA: hypothetical protein ENI59_02155 [Euryarchaeota archaeon]|nr:hypothetical protein [Euryarchaeota archaeon]